MLGVCCVVVFIDDIELRLLELWKTDDVGDVGADLCAS